MSVWTLIPSRLLLPAVGIAASALVFIAGCSRTIVKHPQATDYDPADENAELDFWHSLPGRWAVTNDEGLHGVLVFADEQDPTRTYADRVALLKERGWISSSFDEPPNMAIQRGTLARALCHVLDIKGGVMMHLTNGNARYSERELVYLDIMGPGTEQQVLSGLEYLGVISKAQDYQMLHQASQVARSQPSEEPQPQ